MRSPWVPEIWDPFAELLKLIIHCGGIDMANIISGIYMITCNDHVYVGQSVNIKARWRQHRKGWNMCKKDKTRKPQNKFMQNVFNKYGMENMKFSILIQVDAKLVEKVGYLATRDLLKVLEQTYMNMYNPDLNIYGASGSPLGHKHTDEFKEKKRQNRLNYKHKDETKEAIRQAHLGKNKSPDSVAKSALAISLPFSIYHKELGLIQGRNITAYARDKKLSRGSLVNVIKGESKHYNETFFRTKEDFEKFVSTYKPPASIHKGVTRIKDKDCGKIWRVRLGVDGKRILIGDYESEMQAAEVSLIARQVYDVN